MADKAMLSRVVNALLGLQMLSEGSTYSWDRARASATGDDALPVSFTKAGTLREHEWSPYEYHRWRITTSTTTSDLADRVMAAETALEEARTGVQPPSDQAPSEPAELRLWVLMNCEGMRSAEVARRTGMSVSWVRWLREKAGKSQNTGESLR